ncbi:hypothetical protein QZH41_012547, partial [Actinostola sp. cb2023]
KGEKSSGMSELGVPMTYDKRYKVNVSILTGDVIDDKKSKHKKGTIFDVNVSLWIFNKIVKLKNDQSNLPISHFREHIVDAVKSNQVVIIAGDTGCGKSTQGLEIKDVEIGTVASTYFNSDFPQVPQYLLNTGFTNIACTQPRRIACISLAKRVGYETLKEYGSDVAYQIRFEASKTKATRILFLTEGLLLRQLSSDPDLSQYNVVVVDEVHERHLHGDFLLGMLRCLIEGRADLKVILMSATININLFAGYFDGAPVIQQSKPTSRAERLDPSPYLRIIQLIDKKYPITERGDLLMFLSGMSEIAAVVEAAKEYAQKTRRWIILPLHSSLSVEEQDKVFDVAPDGVRKCVVSTNIAETSITIDGIRFIADSGKVKEMNFDAQSKMERLQEFWISQASAEQRKGRAGRTGPGVCYRLYSESDYHAFSQYATPEIQRTSLDTTILHMISLGINNVRVFSFIEPPPTSSIENSLYFLKQQDAVTEDETLTPIGQMLARLPVDVVIGKMLLMGSLFHLTEPVMIIAAGLSVQSPFTRRLDHDPDMTSRREELESDHGDPFTLLNAYDEWLQVKSREGHRSRKWCKRRGLEEQRFYEMSKLKRQFEDLLHDHGLIEREEIDESDEDEREKEKFKRRQLKRMKQDHHKSTRRRKLLKLDEDESDDVEPGTDIRDIEFKMNHDLDKLMEDSSARRNFTLRDINLLKIILCSGLYPNLAVPDEANSFKRDSDQTFHSKNKQYLMIHPTSVFSTRTDVLEPQSTRDFPQQSGDQSRDQSRGTFSGLHQLVAYVSLLETNKPYLVNLMRVPGLQTLFLFARSLDTNADLTRVVADAWLEVQCDDVKAAQEMISAVLQLRGTWARLLELRLEAKLARGNSLGLEMNKCRDLERLLAQKLGEFLDSNIRYSMTRLLSSDEKHLYIGPHNPRNLITQSSEALPFKRPSMSIDIHPIKGGIRVNEYLTYNCLQDVLQAEASSIAAQYIKKHWQCEVCQVKMVVTVLERLQHESECSNDTKTTTATQDIPESSTLPSVDHLRKTYLCTECCKEYWFTSTEILKHRKTHR